MENRLQIAGVVGNSPETRYSPAGIPIARFTLRHQSQQSEAGMQRQVLCNIGVVASGEALLQIVQQLQTGEGVRVIGFLARANNRQGENRLILHADSIETITI
ncbi:MAG: primosomal replication protein N [Gammaproteobacteria bacterium]|nr:primosomal replication protein N [Gammaproteobacteria bacterium]MCW8993834.1 primosomal replication protein N [Gammaproteobacteria bacterium]MCW9088423.1 primosomal replication protein N [Gammaproteobacteria bacterium]